MYTRVSGWLLEAFQKLMFMCMHTSIHILTYTHTHFRWHLKTERAKWTITGSPHKSCWVMQTLCKNCLNMIKTTSQWQSSARYACIYKTFCVHVLIKSAFCVHVMICQFFVHVQLFVRHPSANCRQCMCAYVWIYQLFVVVSACVHTDISPYARIHIHTYIHMCTDWAIHGQAWVPS